MVNKIGRVTVLKFTVGMNIVKHPVYGPFTPFEGVGIWALLWRKEKTENPVCFLGLLDLHIRRHIILARRRDLSLLKVLGRMTLAKKFRI